MLYHDETIMQLGGSRQRVWGKRGKTSQFYSSGSRSRIIVSGAIDVTSGESLIELTDEMKSNNFEDFLIHVLATYPGMEINFVTDNASWHKSKDLKPFLEVNPRLKLIFLPPYAPELNPVEKLWKSLKRSVCHNRYFKKIVDLKEKILEFKYSINQQKVLVLRRVGLTYS